MWRKIQILGAVFLGVVFWFFSMVLAGGGLYMFESPAVNTVVRMNRLTGKMWVYTYTYSNGIFVSGWAPLEGKLKARELQPSDFIPVEKERR